jgi:hypothetical protein
VIIFAIAKTCISPKDIAFINGKDIGPAIKLAGKVPIKAAAKVEEGKIMPNPIPAPTPKTPVSTDVAIMPLKA